MKVLVCGLGAIAKKHISVLKLQCSEVQFFALRHSVESDSFQDVINVFTINELLDLNLDFAIISTPTYKHVETIRELLVLNIPLFIEKPVSSSLNVADIIQKIESKNIFTYIACNLRFLDCLIFVKDCLKKRRTLNEVNVYCGSYLPSWRPNQEINQSYSSKAELGGGVHLDLIHELDYLFWFFGLPTNVNRYFKSSSSLGISSVDYANYILDYDSFSVNVVLNYFRRIPKRSLELVFEDDILYVDLLNNTVFLNDEKVFSSNQRISDTYETQMRYFLHCIKKGVKSSNSISEGLDVLKIAIEV